MTLNCLTSHYKHINMQGLRFFKVIVEAYKQTKDMYVTSESGFNMANDKGYKSLETGGFRTIITGEYITSLKLEEFELEGEDPKLDSKEYYYKKVIGKSLGKFKIPIDVDVDGRLYIPFDVLANNIVLYPNGEVYDMLNWYTIHGNISIKHTEYVANRVHRKMVVESVCNIFNLKGELFKLIDFTRL